MIENKQFSVDFWRWFFNNKLSGFRRVTLHDRVLNNCKNIFAGHQKYNLTIDLAAGECIDEDDQSLTYPMAEFVAQKRGLPKDKVEHSLEVEHAAWKKERDTKEEYRVFKRDEKELRWTKKDKDDNYIEVTAYDIIINAVIESYDLKVDKWNRKFECTLRWHKLGRLRTKDIELTPEQTHSFNNFSESIWKEATIRTKNLTNAEMRHFWDHLESYYQPRVVREFNHYGFIDFEDEKYYLAENVLIKFPESSSQKLQLVAKNKGAFQVKENKYVKSGEEPIYLPHFDVGVPQDGQYKAAMNRLYDNQLFEKKLNGVIDEFCSMVGGQSAFRQWGKLIVGYVFSFLFFEDIYKQFNHVIFLYFYGEGNVGKGEVVKRILDFYGIAYQDSLNTPRPRSVDNAIEQKSQIPLWIDEHKPQIPGQDFQIKDQEWNSWFELKMRQTNIQKGVSYAIERKAVRTMPVFCSNFKPKTDHLLSRCIIMEYRRERRGPEKHVRNLKNDKELLQRLMLSFMQKYKLLNRKAFVWDIDRLRSTLKKDVKTELSKRSGNAILQDRQIEQFATLLAVYHWLYEEYRAEITNLYKDAQKAENESDKGYRNDLKEILNKNLKDVAFDRPLYKFVKQQTVSTAVNAAQHNPFTDYIETISTLIEAGDITDHHFNWMDDGTLKIWAKAVWDKYLAAKRGTDDVVRRDVVEEKLKEMSDLDSEGGLKLVNWTPPSSQALNDEKKIIRAKGFYIPRANENQLLAQGFQVHKFNPQAYINPNSDAATPQQEEPQEQTGKQIDFNEKPPF